MHAGHGGVVCHRHTTHAGYHAARVTHVVAVTSHSCQKRTKDERGRPIVRGSWGADRSSTCYWPTAGSSPPTAPHSYQRRPLARTTPRRPAAAAVGAGAAGAGAAGAAGAG